MFNENSTDNQGVVNKWCMPKRDYSSSDTPGGLYKWGEDDQEDRSKLMQNTLHLFDHIKNDKYIFSKIITNVITFLNILKEEKKYYEFLFSYNTFVKKYGPLTEYTAFKKVIERINEVDIIEVCISFNFSNDDIFQTLLSSYLELHLNEANNIYNVLLELTNVVIDGYAIWEEQNGGDMHFVDILISQSELKYISREQINKWFSYVKQKEDNYSHVLFSLIDFCLSLINHVHASLAEGAVACAAYTQYVNQLVILRRSPSPSGEAHHKKHAETQGEKLKTDECAEEVRKENAQLGLCSRNDVPPESDSKKERTTELTTYVKDTPGHIYICTFGDKIVCMKNGDYLEEHSNDMTTNEDRSKFVYEVKSRSANLYILKILVCTILKAMKVAHHMNQELLKKLFSFFNNVLSDIIKCLYQKKDLLFLNLFFTDILKTMHVLISFYNENIEQTPKRTMLFYKCFNKVIDQICIYLHNKTFFNEMLLGRGEGTTHVGKCLKKYAHNFKETCYMLFCLFYAILEKINRVNNEIFLFFCCVFDGDEQGVLEPIGVVNQSAGESTEPPTVTSLYRTLCLNREFLHKCRKDLPGKSINRIINIFIFLEKKINKYFFFFKYIFGYVWDRFCDGAMNANSRTSRLHRPERNDWRRGRGRWPPRKPPNKLQTVMKRIKYVLLDMFTKYTKLLMVYRYQFSRCTVGGKEKEPFRDEFLMYMKSIEWVLFSIFMYSPNGVLTKLNAYATERGKLGKLAHGGRSQFSAFNRGLYCFGEGQWSMPSDSSSGTSTGTSTGTSRRVKRFSSRQEASPDRSASGSDSSSGSGCQGEDSQTVGESEALSDDLGTDPCDLIVLNVLGIIYAIIMEELTSQRYRYVYFKRCLVHAEFVKKLRVVLLGSGRGDLVGKKEEHPLGRDGPNGVNMQPEGMETDVDVDVGGEVNVEREHLACYFDFPYELLCVIIIQQLKCFSNDTLKCYTICTAVVEFLFYISSSKNPYFFTISRRLWRLLGRQINEKEETLALKMLTKIFFHVLSGRSKEDTLLRSRNERMFTQSICNNDQQYLLLSFLRKQFFVNDVGKNYFFFFGTLLRGIQSEELALGVMQFFLGTFHVHLQYTLNVLLRFLNLYERGVEAAAREASGEVENGQVDDGGAASTSEPIEEDNIISLFVYFDLVNIFPPNFLSIVGDLNLTREVQKTILFFTYVYDEYRLLEQREEENKHILMVRRIKQSGMQYYHSSAKIYFPLVISSLISHYLYFLLKDSTSRIPDRIICSFYENFFSNRYLYTLCSNHVYMRVLSDSFVILQRLRGSVATGGEVSTDRQWGVVNCPEEDNHKSDQVNERDPEKYTKEDLTIEEKDTSSDQTRGDCSNQLGNLTSCLFQVYEHFLEEYATLFHAAIVTMIKHNILWRGERGTEHPNGSSTGTRLNQVSTPRRLSDGCTLKRLGDPTIQSDFATLDESTFCQQMYLDLNREGKYTPAFAHLMRSLLDVFFCKAGIISRESYRQVLAKELVPLAVLQTEDKVDLVQTRRNKFLITFFRNTFYVHSCTGDYIKDSLSKLGGQPPFGKHRVCRKDLEELARLVFCVGDWVDI
ncbi:Uncharacterized protein PCOAH_00017150 [Plasmodium coatneyi]|uniref:Uncharacterized protein n=1 Tax=Plasmodium coatneyi TaxID=208452 RepID=A0A1B1DXE7_9APIC|nr:Uncharacterized protein PCOAH_00017150 [Plasmodium coatneyi]ANQ07299.1 Uncharacterized protein PCOAH_00017150 [Plasmodium coatneyi]